MTQVRFKNLATPTEKACFPRAGRQIGARGRKTRPNGSLVGSGVIEPAARRTDTKSDVLVAVFEARPRFATHFFTEIMEIRILGNVKKPTENNVDQVDWLISADEAREWQRQQDENEARIRP